MVYGSSPVEQPALQIDSFLSDITISDDDIVGLEYMAKAGFDPRAAVDLWQNMSAQGGKKPPEHLSTHPASETRIENLISQWQTTLPIYNQARADGKEPNCQTTWN